MSAREFFWKHDVGVKITLLAVAFLLVANLVVLNRTFLGSAFGESREKIIEKIVQPAPAPAVYECDASCQKIIDEKIAQATATLVVRTEAKSTTTFVSIGGTASTTKTDWTDVRQGELYLDLADYGGSPTVSWEASLKVAHANGKTFARLFDATNGIAVAASEISVENSADYKQVSSGNLALWRGRNLYRVQIKSLNTFEVFIDSARIKIVTK